jgi:O-antigen/teichoic acid export membrane protein
VSAPGRHQGETREQQVNRELIEFLNELRVALPGVQTLFAFLLILPFSNGWKDTTDFQRDVYIVAVLATAVSTLLLIAPSAQHRLLFRAGDKENLLLIGNRCAVAGVAALATAMSAVLFLIVEVVLGASWAAAIGAVAAGSFAIVWFGLPLLRRARLRPK